MKIKDCMTSTVCWCTPNDTVFKAIDLMGECHIGCIPVCDDESRVVGIVTDRDILLRCVKCNKDVKTTKITDVMTTKVCCCNEYDDIDYAEKCMADMQVRRIPVINEGKLVGMLSLGDLAHNDTKIGKNNVCDTLENICKCGDGKKNAE